MKKNILFALGITCLLAWLLIVCILAAIVCIPILILFTAIIVIAIIGIIIAIPCAISYRVCKKYGIFPDEYK